MPVSKNWSKATQSHVKKNVPSKPGIYELKSFGELVYIGSSDDLRDRLLTHLSERSPNYYRYETVTGILSDPEDREQEAYDNYVDNHGTSPRWNDRRP